MFVDGLIRLFVMKLGGGTADVVKVRVEGNRKTNHSKYTFED